MFPDICIPVYSYKIGSLQDTEILHVKGTVDLISSDPSLKGL